MAFEDIKDSIQWSNEGGRVFAYFTAHFAKQTDDQNKQEHDTVRYAIGHVTAAGNTLVGELQAVYANTERASSSGSFDTGITTVGVDEGMEIKPTLSYHLEIHAAGTVGVQPKINGNPIGGMPVEMLAGSSVSPGLIRAASSTTAYTISLDRQAKEVIPK